MIEVLPLTIDDIDAAMQLVEAAGWNQTPDDWRRVIEYQPWGCFKATLDTRLIGTVTSTSYGSALAWIGMMLVDPNSRRQGAGRALMQRVIQALQTAGTETIKLDATPMGRPLYEQLGFVSQFDFQRWRRAENPLFEDEADCIDDSIAIAIGPEHEQLDRLAFGVDRAGWLKLVASASRICVEPSGFGMIRQGRIADYLGPIVASSDTVARQIVSKLVCSTCSVIFWDLPIRSEPIIELARELGFESVRDLTRMTLELDSTRPRLDLQYALCDPACG